jgi:hypothetical protein
MELTAVKIDYNTFRIPFDADLEKVKQIKEGEPRKWKITLPRNLFHHRKFMAILKTVLDNDPGEQFGNDMDFLLNWVKIKTGLVTVKEINGQVFKYPKSIKFESMKQDEFSEFYNKAVLILAEYLQVSPAELEQNTQLNF